jgi:hypothetical protein
VSHRARFLFILGVLAAVAATGASISAATNNRDTVRAGTNRAATRLVPNARADGGLKTSKVMCGIANLAVSGKPGRKLKAYGSSRGWFGAILADFFLSSVQEYCEDVVDRAGRVLVRMFRSERKPSSQSTTTRSTILNLLDVQSAARIANNVAVRGRRVSTTYVLNGADETCQAFRNRTPAMSVIARYFPGARLELIGPMNGFVRLVIARCPLNTYGANFLSGAMLNYLLSNESARDLEAPSAWVYSVTGNRYTNGTSELRADWLGSDRGSGVKAYAVWMWRDGYWYQLTPSTTSGGWKITLRQGIRYQWAVRAIDGAGNVSPWSYSNVYAA